MPHYSSIIGIDLGTTNSLAAVWSDQGIQVVPGPKGHRFTPSVIHVPPHGPVSIGQAALHAKVSDPQHTVFAAKRFIGRKYNEIFDLAQSMPCTVDIDEHFHPVFDLGHVRLLPQVVGSLIIRSLKAAAETFTGRQVEGAVISVPAYFGATQRAATIEAVELAGLSVYRLLEEPTAAAMACRVASRQDQKVAVLDLGGGTFDVTLVEVADVDDEKQYEVLSVTGDGFLGGDSFDERLALWLLESAEYELGIELRRDADTLARFLDVATAAKHQLSEQRTAEVLVRSLRTANGDAVDYTHQVTRTMFEELCEDLFERLRPPCMDALRMGGVKAGEVDQVILVGGASRMPRVRQIAAEIFGRTPFSSVNPFEAIALGAAAQGATLAGLLKDQLLLDVVPHSLGLELADGSAIRMLKRNTTVPTKFSQVFGIGQGSTSAQLVVLEGDGAMARDNRVLGELSLDGLGDAETGRLEVAFDVDANRILRVELHDLMTGRRVRSTLRPDSGYPASQREALRALGDALWARAEG